MSDRRPPLQAWYYEAVDNGVEVLFARSEAGARARMMRQNGLRWEDTEGTLTRCEQFDKYVPGPLTCEQFHAEGWIVYCWHCEHRLDSDECWRCSEERKEDNPALVVTESGHVFCSEECRDEHNACCARIRQKKADATAALLKRFPFVLPLGTWIGGHGGECDCYRKDSENICVRFKVPGGELSEKTIDGNAFHNTYCFDCRLVWIARGDYDAFQEWRGVKPDCVVEGKL